MVGESGEGGGGGGGDKEWQQRERSGKGASQKADAGQEGSDEGREKNLNHRCISMNTDEERGEGGAGALRDPKFEG